MFRRLIQVPYAHQMTGPEHQPRRAFQSFFRCLYFYIQKHACRETVIRFAVQIVLFFIWQQGKAILHFLKR